MRSMISSAVSASVPFAGSSFAEDHGAMRPGGTKADRRADTHPRLLLMFASVKTLEPSHTDPLELSVDYE